MMPVLCKQQLRRLRLQELGILLWIPKAYPVLPTQFGLMHDVIQSSIHPSDTPSTSASEVRPTIDSPVAAHPVQLLDDTATSSQALTPARQAVVVPAEVAFDYHQPSSSALPDSHAVVSFSIPLLQRERFILFAQVEDAEQLSLWQNIQSACQAQSSRLTWPLAFENWPMHSLHLQSYLDGFLSINQHKILLSLGNLNVPLLEQHIEPTHRYPSLAEMLQQPQAKRQLWKRLKQIMNI